MGVTKIKFKLVAVGTAFERVEGGKVRFRIEASPVEKQAAKVSEALKHFGAARLIRIGECALNEKRIVRW